jgi:hypothetical protein
MGHRPVKHDDPTMSGQRSHNEIDGRMRQKRSDTLASTLELEHKVELKVRGDTTLAEMRRRTGETSVQVGTGAPAL